MVPVGSCSKFAPGCGGGGRSRNDQLADLRVCILFRMFRVISNFSIRVRIGKFGFTRNIRNKVLGSLLQLVRRGPETDPQNTL